MSFEVQVDPEQPEMLGGGLEYLGQRFRAECRLAGKVYGQPFGVDVAFGDPILGEPETIVAEDLLGFAGVPPPEPRVYPVESHVAEELHAYTLPRRLPNTRVKDLPDLALLAQIGPLDARRVRAALQQTFEFRATHSLPTRLPARRPGGQRRTRAWRRRTSLCGRRWMTLRARRAPSSTPSSVPPSMRSGVQVLGRGRKQGGRIRVESPTGGGTTFSVELPCEAVAAAAESQPVVQEPFPSTAAQA